MQWQEVLHSLFPPVFRLAWSPFSWTRHFYPWICNREKGSELYASIGKSNFSRLCLLKCSVVDSALSVFCLMKVLLTMGWSCLSKQKCLEQALGFEPSISTYVLKTTSDVAEQNWAGLPKVALKSMVWLTQWFLQVCCINGEILIEFCMGNLIERWASRLNGEQFISDSQSNQLAFRLAYEWTNGNPNHHNLTYTYD